MPAFNQSVYSDMAEEVGWDERGMIVLFKTGKKVVYLEVPEEEARSIANAGSVGTAINNRIKGRYTFRYI